MNVIKLLGICSLYITLLLPLQAHAESGMENGWFGNFRVGGGLISSRPSGLDVFDENEKLYNLTSRGSQLSEGFPLFGLDIGYRFQGIGTTISTGTGMESPFHLTLGQEMGDLGSLTLSALYDNEDVWENPYLTGVNRSKTDAESLGFAFTWDNILNTKIGAMYEQKSIDVKNDLIALSQPELQRDGTDTTFGLSYLFNYGAAGEMTANVRYSWIDRDGVSNSGSGYGVGLTHELGFGRLQFATGLDYSQTDYDNVHPIFNKTREESVYVASETVTFLEPFGVKSTYLFGVVAYSETIANINFFDSSNLILGTGIGYRF